MRVVIVDGDVSYPATSGKRLRTLHLMLQLAPRHQITYIGRCAAGSEEARLAPAFLRDHGIEPVLVHDPVARKSGLSFYARLAGNLFSPAPYSVASHHSPIMAKAIADVARRQPIDLWQAEWTAYLDLLPPDHPAPRLLIAHNVDSLIWQRYHENETRLLKRLYIGQQWRKFRRYEAAALQRADRVVAVSEEDADLISTKFGQPEVDVVENGFERGYFENVVPERDPNTILFLGALDWRPNLDAADLLLERIFPRVRSLRPNAKLSIVGRNPPPGLVQRIAQSPGVELHANVADVRPYLGTAAVMTVPLRIGGGSRLKIIEALACRLPVVSTRVGAEGLRLVPGEHFDEADETAMAEALVKSLDNPTTAHAQAERGREFVVERYDWEVLGRKLEQVWDRCVQDGPGDEIPALATESAT